MTRFVLTLLLIVFVTAFAANASASNKPLMSVADAAELGGGAIIDIIPKGDRWVVVDETCGDGCFNIVAVEGKELKVVATAGASFGAKKLQTVAPARHVENAYLWSDGEKVGVVQVGSETVKSLGTTEIKGVTGFVGLATGAYVATSDALHFAKFTDGKAKVLLTQKAADRKFVDTLTGEHESSKFAPRWIETDGKDLFVGMADGSVWQVDIRIQDGVKFRAGFKPGANVRQVTFGAYGPLVSTDAGMAPARARGSELYTPEGGAAAADVHSINDGWALFVIDEKKGPGIVQVSSDSDGKGNISYSYNWTLLAKKGATHIAGFKNDTLGLGAITARPGMVELLLKSN